MNADVRAYLAENGRKGGKNGVGASKARQVTSEQARKAARARWGNQTPSRGSKRLPEKQAEAVSDVAPVVPVVPEAAAAPALDTDAAFDALLRDMRG